MSTDLYYFSATGNTLYVARELQKRLPNSKLIPIVGLLSPRSIKTRSATIGIISPLHGMTLPIPVETFVRKLDPGSATYIFAVTTRGGTRSRGFSKMQRILERKKKRLDASFIIDMPNNDPKFKIYQVPSNKELRELERRLLGKLNAVSQAILNKEPQKVGKNDGATFPYIRPISALLEMIVSVGMAFAKYMGINDYFYIDEKCRGCGTCEEVCLSGKIHLVEKSPEWRRSITCY